MVVHQVGGDAKQVAAPVIVALEGDVRAQEPVIGFLQQVVGEAIVARHPRQIHAHRPRRQLVERPEGLLGHLERPFGFVEGAEAFHVGEGESRMAGVRLRGRRAGNRPEPRRDEKAMSAAIRKPTPSAKMITPTTVKARCASSPMVPAASRNPTPTVAKHDAGHHRPDDRTDRRAEAGRFRFAVSAARTRGSAGRPGSGYRPAAPRSWSCGPSVWCARRPAPATDLQPAAMLDHRAHQPDQHADEGAHHQESRHAAEQHAERLEFGIELAAGCRQPCSPRSRTRRCGESRDAAARNWRQLRIRRHVVGAAHQARVAPQDFADRVADTCAGCCEAARAYSSACLDDADRCRARPAAPAAGRRPAPGCKSQARPGAPG